MKAAVVTRPGHLEIRSLPDPEIGPYEAACDLLYGAVCAGTDTHLLHGHAPFCDWVSYPLILGHESIGRVTAVGENVTHLKPGDLVTRVGSPAVGGVSAGWGGFASRGVATDWRAMRDAGLSEDRWSSATVQQVLPEDTDPAAATLFITWRETLSYTRRLGVAAGSRVLIIGSGGNGLAFVRHAANLGAKQITVVGSPARRELAQRLGATDFVDYRAADADAQADAAAAQGYDRVIDVIGRPETAAMSLKLTVDGGTFGLYGLDRPPGEVLPENANDGRVVIYDGGYDEAEAHDQVLEHYQAGRLDANDWIDPTQAFPLDRLGEAMESVAQRRLVKPLIRLQEESGPTNP